MSDGMKTARRKMKGKTSDEVMKKEVKHEERDK